MAIEVFNIVYVLSNPAMQGLVKIGFTAKDSAQARIDQLYTTGVPVPFNLEFAARVQNPTEVEKALHIAFGPYRINSKREFFSIEPEQAVAILKLLHTEEETDDIRQQESQLDPQSIAAAQTLKSRRPPLNFVEMGIPIGAELQSTHHPITVVVSAAKKVILDAEEMSLTAATRQVLGLDYDVRPNVHWVYNGRRLDDIYEETYGVT